MGDRHSFIKLRLTGRKNSLASVPTSKKHEEAKLLPESKEGRRVVAMVGDGINDAPVCLLHNTMFMSR